MPLKNEPPFGYKSAYEVEFRTNKELLREIEHLKSTQNCPVPFHINSDCWCDSSLGGPVCNCKMKNVREVGGRYIHFTDVGPVKEASK